MSRWKIALVFISGIATGAWLGIGWVRRVAASGQCVYVALPNLDETASDSLTIWCTDANFTPQEGVVVAYQNHSGSMTITTSSNGIASIGPMIDIVGSSIHIGGTHYPLDKSFNLLLCRRPRR